MRSGKVAKSFGIDPKTLYRWTEEFTEFFSPDALGEGRTQREYNAQDLVVMNTIMKLRSKRVDTEEIRARLAAGDLDTVLPPEATAIPGENAVMVYAQLRQLEAAVVQYQGLVEQLRTENKSDREQFEEKRKEYEARIGDLREDIGRYKTKIEILEELLNKKKPQDDE